MKNKLIYSFLCMTIFTASAVADENCVDVSFTDHVVIQTALTAVEASAGVSSIQVSRGTDGRATVVNIVDANRNQVSVSVRLDCRSGSISRSVILNPDGFVCKQGWVNCMPSIGLPPSKFCSEKFMQWSETNCGGRPQIAH